MSNPFFSESEGPGAVADQIDAALQTVLLSGTHAARPTASADNLAKAYFETDTGELFRSNGTDWVRMWPVNGEFAGFVKALYGLLVGWASNYIGMKFEAGDQYRMGLNFDATGRTAVLESIAYDGQGTLLLRTGTNGDPIEHMRLNSEEAVFHGLADNATYAAHADYADNTPSPPGLGSGTVVLDADGNADLYLGFTPSGIAVSSNPSPGDSQVCIGTLTAAYQGTGIYQISSAAGGADSGCVVGYVYF